MRKCLANFLLGISLLGWVSVGPYPAVAESLTDFFNKLAVSQGSPYARDPQASAAAADGMQLLARLMTQIGYDRQQAWRVFAQSPEGQRIMRVPGALSLLTDWFNATMALSSGPHPPANSEPETKSSIQSADQAGGEVSGTLTPPFLGPYRPNAYGPGINSDAAGRPFVWQPDNAPADPFARVRPDVFGPGIGMDQYGRPVHAACPPFQQTC